VKTTTITRSVANPQRTTLAHLNDAGEPVTAYPVRRPEETASLPSQTANPRRTILVDAPAS